ncbi:hypothetical protein D9M71_806420 [compost metagenome]
MGHGPGLREIAIAQQDADTATILSARVIRRFTQLRVGGLRRIQGWREPIDAASDTQVTQQGLVMHIVEASILSGTEAGAQKTWQRNEAAFGPFNEVFTLNHLACAGNHIKNL